MLANIAQLMINGLALGVVYALISLGLTLIFGVTRVINFAHGEFLMLGMYTTFWLSTLLGLNVYLTLVFSGVFVALVGFALQRSIIEYLQRRMAPAFMVVFATLLLSIIIQNVALLLWKSDYRSVISPIAGKVISIGGISLQVSQLAALLGACVLSVGTYLFLEWTYVGNAIMAIAQERKGALLMGINVYKTYAITFALGGALVGAAGMLLTPMYYISPTVGARFALTAYIIVVLGGMGSLLGAVVGSLIIGQVEVFSGFFISPHLNQAIYYVIFIAILLFKPTGLFGKAGSEEVGFK